MGHERDLGRCFCSHGGSSNPQGHKWAGEPSWEQLSGEQIRVFPPSSSSLPWAAPAFLRRRNPALGSGFSLVWLQKLLRSKKPAEYSRCRARASRGHKHPRGTGAILPTCWLSSVMKGTKEPHADSAIKGGSMNLI